MNNTQVRYFYNKETNAVYRIVNKRDLEKFL